MKDNHKGFGVVEVLAIIVIIGLIGAVGWLVYDRQKNRSDEKVVVTSQVTKEVTKDTRKQETVKVDPPKGWVKYKDASSGVSFYHPDGWNESKIHVHKTGVSNTIAGTNHSKYSAKYVFKKAENKWYQLDNEGAVIQSRNDYSTDTTFPVSSYPAVYGLAGEGGAGSYYAVFTDGMSSYLIELPAILEETNLGELDVQKQAVIDLVKTIEVDK